MDAVMQLPQNVHLCGCCIEQAYSLHQVVLEGSPIETLLKSLELLDAALGRLYSPTTQIDLVSLLPPWTVFSLNGRHPSAASAKRYRFLRFSSANPPKASRLKVAGSGTIVIWIC